MQVKLETEFHVQIKVVEDKRKATLPDYCFVAHSQMDPTPTYRLQSNVFFTGLTAAAV